ncbi:vacuolar protein sorting-associated protein 54-like [Haliotis cracherodii]|uniref:vacuolar protein sorting-associated protein 54-like n=1 Tax=Haliotis cracherodii TaxID=6455 RepID=UPI0039EC12A6
MSTKHEVQKAQVSWKKCVFCREAIVFKSPREFCQHLRDFHCSKEGGSYVCRYGMNGVCPSLPLEGVSDRDYEDHVARDHVYSGDTGARNKSLSSQSRPSSSSPPTSTEPSVVTDQFKWTVYNAVVNLPAVLNNPRLARRETDFFTKTWGQEFEKQTILPSPYIPEITAEHFEKYVHRTSARHKKHVRNSQKLSEPPVPSQHAFPTLNLKQLEKNRAELDQIPKLFMLPNFSLENLDTFSAVFPWTQVEESMSGAGETKQSSKLLQERMSHYLDVVEVQIAKQISIKSEAFFHAMTSHDELQDQLLHTCQAIKQLRDKVHSLDDRLAVGSLNIMHKTRARANYVSLHNKLKLMSTIHQTQPTIQLLLSTNEFVGALDLISTSQEILSQELAGVHSFRHLGSQLAEMEKLIDKMLLADFLKYVTSELNRPVTDLEVLTGEEKLVSILFGLLRQNKLNFVDVYREEAFTALKAVIKQTVVEAVSAADDIDTEGNVGSLADQMRLLNYPQWMSLLKHIFSNMMQLLQRTQAFHGVMSDVIGIAAGRTKAPTPVSTPTSADKQFLEEPSHLHVSVSEDVDVMITEAEYTKLSLGLKEMLCAVCDNAHDRCVKVVVARAKDGFLERLSSSEFVALCREVEGFVGECETICGRPSTSLRGSLQNQANRFVARFHEERKNKLSLILDNERWKQADVPTEFQDLVDHIAATGALSIPERRIDSDGRKPSEFITIDGEKYAVVGTVLMLIKMVVEYCQCLNDIPTAAPDLLTRLIDLLKTFNSRTCQLVLGAGALQLVGLKKITTKTLALASRALQLVVHYMPRVKAHFEDQLPSRNVNMLKHFEQIIKDYKDHIDEINNKLLTIMENMMEAQLSQYEVKAPMPSACFRSLCKQMAKLHEAIIEILPVSQVKALFVRINQSFKQILSRHLVRLNVCNDGGPQYGLVTSDLLFYAGNFRTLKGIECLCENMNDVWLPR